MILTLIQICMWLAEREAALPAGHDKVACNTVLQLACTVGEELCDPDLQALATNLPRESASGAPQSQRAFAVMWERYAVTQFHGRLLPRRLSQHGWFERGSSKDTAVQRVPEG